MISSPDARRSNSLDAELDALVAREVDALALRQVRTGPKPRASRRDEVADAAHETEGETLEFPTRRSRTAARPKSSADNVIGIRHGGQPGGTDVLAFSAEEEAFIEQAVAFLRGRVNADVIIEEVWNHTVSDRDEPGTEQRLENETDVAAEPSAPDDDEQIREPIPSADPDPLAADDERVMPLQAGAAKTRVRRGAAETNPEKPAQPISPRGKQEPNNSQGEGGGDDR